MLDGILHPTDSNGRQSWCRLTCINGMPVLGFSLNTCLFINEALQRPVMHSSCHQRQCNHPDKPQPGGFWLCTSDKHPPAFHRQHHFSASCMLVTAAFRACLHVNAALVADMCLEPPLALKCLAWSANHKKPHQELE